MVRTNTPWEYGCEQFHGAKEIPKNKKIAWNAL